MGDQVHRLERGYMVVKSSTIDLVTCDLPRFYLTQSTTNATKGEDSGRCRMQFSFYYRYRSSIIIYPSVNRSSRQIGQTILLLYHSVQFYRY